MCSSLEHFQEEFEDVSKEDQVMIIICYYSNNDAILP